MPTKQTAEAVERGNLYQRLLAITEEAGVPKTGKADAKVGGYAFHRIDDIEDHIKHLLCKHRVLALPTVVERVELSAVKTKSGEHQRIAMKVEVEFINPDNPDEKFTKAAWGEGEDRSDKMSGNAQSYALKNAYLAAFHLKGKPDNEDTDSAEPTEGVTPKVNGKYEPATNPDDAITKPKVKRLWAIALNNGWTDGEVFKNHCREHFGVSPYEIPWRGDAYEVICAYYESTPPDPFAGIEETNFDQEAAS
jgi:hypothetical protein